MWPLFSHNSSYLVWSIQWALKTIGSHKTIDGRITIRSVHVGRMLVRHRPKTRQNEACEFPGDRRRDRLRWSTHTDEISHRDMWFLQAWTHHTSSRAKNWQNKSTWYHYQIISEVHTATNPVCKGIVPTAFSSDMRSIGRAGEGRFGAGLHHQYQQRSTSEQSRIQKRYNSINMQWSRYTLKKQNFVALCTRFNTYSDPVTWTDCFPFCYES